jgi:hypothetical protein
MGELGRWGLGARVEEIRDAKRKMGAGSAEDIDELLAVGVRQWEEKTHCGDMGEERRGREGSVRRTLK